MQAAGNKLKQNWKIFSEKNYWNSARLEIRSQVLTCSTFCKLAWSWHGQWHWQGYHVQVQFKSPMITNKRYKKWRTFRKWIYGKICLKISNQKISKNHSSHGEQNKRTTRPQRQKLNKNPCKQEEINWSKIEKIIQNKTVGTLQD